MIRMLPCDPLAAAQRSGPGGAEPKPGIVSSILHVLKTRLMDSVGSTLERRVELFRREAERQNPLVWQPRVELWQTSFEDSQQ